MELIGQYETYPSEKNVYEVNGRKYTVTRYFTGDKDLNKVIAELAIIRANMEMGLS